MLNESHDSEIAIAFSSSQNWAWGQTQKWSGGGQPEIPVEKTWKMKATTHTNDPLHPRLTDLQLSPWKEYVEERALPRPSRGHWAAS